MQKPEPDHGGSNLPEPRTGTIVITDTIFVPAQTPEAAQEGKPIDCRDCSGSGTALEASGGTMTHALMAHGPEPPSSGSGGGWYFVGTPHAPVQESGWFALAIILGWVFVCWRLRKYGERGIDDAGNDSEFYDRDLWDDA